MRKSYLKIVLREIKESFGRFAAIFAIILLGVGFLFGLISTTPMMHHSVTTYYNNHNLMDINIKSTLGFNEDDVESINSHDEIDNLMEAYVMDVLIEMGGEVLGSRIYGLPIEDLDINKLTLLEGRLPQESNEVVVERDDFHLVEAHIGDNIIISEENDDLDDAFAQTGFEIVGIVENSAYFQKQAEMTQLGNGRLAVIIYGNYDIFNMDVFTDVFITVEGAREVDTFSDEYFTSIIDPIVEDLEELGEERSQIRYDEIVQEARDEIEESRLEAVEEIEEARAEAEEEIAETLELIELGFITDPAIISEVEAAQVEIDEEINEAYEELEAEIQEAEEEINELKVGEWFVLDRNATRSYVTFELNSSKVDDVVTVFPVFFYLVAALVALTTMSRMVEEDRMQIGTLKALGYSKLTIISKYIIYSGLASLLGSIAGIVIGMTLIPIVIWNAFDTLFHLPEFITLFDIQVALISSGIAILGTIIVTVYVCNHILRSNAASLMQAKAPKPGKRILFERINFLWTRLSFNQKSTIRNIFRYKKHFFMTVIGIAGCMALLLTGFGLRDSIEDLSNIQFNEIILYDMEITFEDDTDDIYQVLDREDVEDFLELHTENGTTHHESYTEDFRIIAVDNINDLQGFIDFRDRVSGQSLDIDNNSVILTEKISEHYDLEVPEVIEIGNFDDLMGEVEVSHITEHYIGSSIYITKDTYNEIFNETVEYNTIYASIHEDTDAETKDNIINNLLSLDNVLTANLVEDNRGAFDDLLNSINYIVVIIIIASGGLAFIVLYNLTNINISERKKELATFRVLGFYNEEVAAYIFRETAILTLIGILVGLGLGTILHQFVIITIEDPDFMFGRDIQLLSYGLSALITIVFAFIVNIFMLKKIRDIKMADSMKAND